MVSVLTVELGYNRVHVVDGPGWRIAIDAGPDYAGAWDTLQSALAGHMPDLVVATHGHLDHAGLGARWLQEGVPVAIGAGDLRWTLGPAASLKDFPLLEGFVRESGAPEDVRAEVFSGLEARRKWSESAAGAGYPPGDGRWPTGLRYAPFAPGMVIGEDGELPGGLRAIACPGHTPGNLVVVDESEGLLFSGDQLLRDITPTPAVQFLANGERFASLPRFVDSMRGLEALGFGRCFPGHGEAFGSVSNVIAANLDQIEQRTDRVYASLKADGPARVFEVAERLYERAARRRFWQVVAVVQGHIDLLQEEGLVTAGPDGLLYAA